MKKRKLKLKELQVKSFVTTFKDEAARTIQGGLLVKKPATTGCLTMMYVDGFCQ